MPEIQNVFHKLSRRASELLSRAEGIDVDWKRDTSISTEDLVAFANSHSGGALLLGVDEARNAQGQQEARIIGCRISDEERLKIINRAQDCVPPIDVTLFVENMDDKPFWRVEIPAGIHKPYCTKAGTYKTRIDGRNASLQPNNLLAIFIESEGRRFLDHFQRVTETLDATVKGINEQIADRLRDLDGQIQQFSNDFARQLESVAGTVDDSADNVMTMISQAIDEKVQQVDFDNSQTHDWLCNIQAGVNGLLEKHGLDDAATLFTMHQVRWAITHHLKAHPEAKPAEIYKSLLHGRKNKHRSAIVRSCIEEKFGKFALRNKQSNPRRGTKS